MQGRQVAENEHHRVCHDNKETMASCLSQLNQSYGPWRLLISTILVFGSWPSNGVHPSTQHLGGTHSFPFFLKNKKLYMYIYSTNLK